MTRRKAHSEFIEEMKIKRPDIQVLGVYINNATKIEFQHNCKYQYRWMCTPQHILRQKRCPKCAGNIKKTTTEFIEEMRLVNPNVKILGEYINNEKKIKVKHIDCGNISYVSPYHLLRGITCAHCFGTNKKTHLEFVEEIKVISPDIEVLGKYTNKNSKIEVKHICGHIWHPQARKLCEGTSCPCCNESKGEKFLSKVLISNNIPFISQFNLVKNPKTNYLLKSDFAILNKENKPILILEYDGEQHFKPVKIFGGEESLKATQYRDSIKDEYCKANNIPFIRFNYKQSENDITDLLLKQLKKMKLI